MKKILFVTSKKIYTEDISFFYNIFVAEDYSSAKRIILKNEDIIFGFFDEMSGIESFLEFLKEEEYAFEFVVNSKERLEEVTKRYLSLGAKDVIDFDFESEDIFEILENYKENELKLAKRAIKVLEKKNKALEAEVVEYQLLYETTKILRLELEFEEIIMKLISLVEGLSVGNTYFLLRKGREFRYYFANKMSKEDSSYLRRFLRKNKFKKISEIPEKFPTYYPFEFEDRVWYILPIVIKSSLKGYLMLIRENDAINESVIETITSILSQAGIVIENAFLIEETQNMSFEMVKSLVKAIEAKDKYTRGHSQRVAELSLLIAHHMNFSNENIRRLEIAAVLHDVGKIGLPENILNKKSSLTPEEYECIKQHPAKGFEIVSEIQNMIDIALIIKSHHERWDGRGYPEGLAREVIPLESRIISIADTYDAMTSDRPYRKGLSHEVAITEIIKNSGSQFDPELSKIFLSFDRDRIEKRLKSWKGHY